MAAKGNHPKFIEAMITLTQRNHDTMSAEEISMWIAQAIDYAPPDLKAEIHTNLQQQNLVPAPVDISPDGEEIYDLADMAKSLGMTEQDALEHLKGMEKQLGRTLIRQPGQYAPIQ